MENSKERKKNKKRGKMKEEKENEKQKVTEKKKKKAKKKQKKIRKPSRKRREKKEKGTFHFFIFLMKKRNFEQFFKKEKQCIKPTCNTWDKNRNQFHNVILTPFTPLLLWRFKWCQDIKIVRNIVVCKAKRKEEKKENYK